MTTVKVKYQGEQQPKKGRKNDVAYDLYTNEDALVTSGAVSATKVSLGITTEFDSEKYGMVVAPRGSFSKLPLTIPNSYGIIEGDYRGDWMLLVRAPILASGLSTKAITLDGEGKIATIDVADISQEALDKAHAQFMQDLTIMNELLASRVPDDILNNTLFKTHVPTGSVFIKKGTKLVQTYLIEKHELEWSKEKLLLTTERGTGALGSSGMN